MYFASNVGKVRCHDDVLKTDAKLLLVDFVMGGAVTGMATGHREALCKSQGALMCGFSVRLGSLQHGVAATF